jgi:hypothetical protein
MCTQDINIKDLKNSDFIKSSYEDIFNEDEFIFFEKATKIILPYCVAAESPLSCMLNQKQNNPI